MQVYPTMFNKTKIVRVFLPGFAKNRRVEKEGLTGGKKSKKRGAPKYAGISNDVYENKGRKKGALGKSDDVDENKHVIGSIQRCL